MDCEKCSGNGEVTCFKCHGKGYSLVANNSNNLVVCDHCYDTGYMSCHYCFGNGRID